jgi:NAD(P)-dependent dehydrogenase (short-subunit alcohol dehydrogenase family)
VEELILTKKHVLVIGGTGMLAGVSTWLVHEGYHVSIIGRCPIKHQHVKEKVSDPESITSIAVDYTNLSELKLQVEKTLKDNGPISTLISWSHSLDSLQAIVEILSNQQKPWELLHVKGSRKYFQNDVLDIPANCQSKSVYLGFVLEGDHSRWLNHCEICNGIIESLQKQTHSSIIGVVEPYSRRPSSFTT